MPVNGVLVIGRTGECDYVVEDTAASRRHAEIVDRGGSFRWRDLDSTNGVLINDMRMLEGELKHGDVMRIGSTVLRFEVDEEAPNTSEMGSTLFRETILDAEGRATDVTEGGDTGRLLEAVYSVMNQIATNYEPCSLSDEILKTTMRAIDAQRGAIFFVGEDTGELLGCPVCNHVHVIQEGVVAHTTRSEIQISNTVARRVVDQGESVLYHDSDDKGDGFNVAESIRVLQLRSILCVPIRGKYGVMGILYVDSNRPGHSYTQEHMLLGTAVGNSAGLALENAQMHQQILEKQRTDQELAYAGIIQAGFLVRKWPDDDARIEVYGETRPAKTVGGDFYDYVRRGENHVGILIGDVSGKGVPAALAMAQILAEFRLQATRLDSPHEVVHALNTTLEGRSQRGMFCSISYLDLDLATGELLTANAGHNPALRVTADDAMEFGEASGPPAGILSEGPWTTSATRLQPGDLVALYTDGILEARSSATHADTGEEHDEYGFLALSALMETQRKAPVKDALHAVMADVERHCAPDRPHDDCTMVVLRYRG